MMTLTAYLMLASLVPSTTYGYGEGMCGDPGHARPCATGAITASGERFDTRIPQVAIALPSKMRIRAQRIRLRIEGGKCQWVRLVDKMNERFTAVRGFDVNPAALRILTGKPATNSWRGRIEMCTVNQ